MSPQLGNLDALVELNVENNGLRGMLPTSLAALTKLRVLNCRDNQLTGPIAEELTDSLTSLRKLHLSWNQLTGPLGHVGHLRHLEVLDAAGNLLRGKLVGKGLETLSRLDILWLHYNRFTGPIPDLSGMQELRQLSLFENLLTGFIPPGLGDLTEVRTCSHAVSSLSHQHHTYFPPFFWAAS